MSFDNYFCHSKKQRILCAYCYMWYLNTYVISKAKHNEDMSDCDMWLQFEIFDECYFCVFCFVFFSFFLVCCNHLCLVHRNRYRNAYTVNTVSCIWSYHIKRLWSMCQFFSTRYCGTSCQERDWPSHKRFCQEHHRAAKETAPDR